MTTQRMADAAKILQGPVRTEITWFIEDAQGAMVLAAYAIHRAWPYSFKASISAVDEGYYFTFTQLKDTKVHIMKMDQWFKVNFITGRLMPD